LAPSIAFLRIAYLILYYGTTLIREGSGQIRAKIYAKALLILLQRDRRKICRVFHTELT